MDEIAARMLRADLDGGRLGTSVSPFVNTHSRGLAQAASDFRCSRYGWGPSATRHKFARQWDLGVKAVDVVDRFLKGFVPEGTLDVEADTLERLVRLSFRLVGYGPESDLASQIVTWLLTAPTVAQGQGNEIEGRLYYLLTAPIKDIYKWINELRSIAGVTDHVK